MSVVDNEYRNVLKSEPTFKGLKAHLPAKFMQLLGRDIDKPLI